VKKVKKYVQIRNQRGQKPYFKYFQRKFCGKHFCLHDFLLKRGKKGVQGVKLKIQIIYNYAK